VLIPNLVIVFLKGRAFIFADINRTPLPLLSIGLFPIVMRQWALALYRLLETVKPSLLMLLRLRIRHSQALTVASGSACPDVKA